MKSLGAVQCSGPSGTSWFYDYYDTAAAAEEQYQALRTAQNLAKNSGPGCNKQVPSESSYSVGKDRTPGRLLCYEDAGTLFFFWNNNGLNMLGLGIGKDRKALYDFWVNAGPFLTAAETALVKKLPASYQLRCKPRPDTGGATATVRCFGQQEVAFLDYRSFSNEDDLKAWYDEVRRGAGVAPGAGSCKESRIPGEAPWGYGTGSGPTEGRLLCFPDQGHARIIWTQTKQLLAGDTTRNDLDHAALYTSWTKFELPGQPK